MSSLKEALQKVTDHELSSARFQSRITWAQNGDANTKYFHAVASTQKNHNAIWSLKDDLGNWISDDQCLKALGIQYFNTMFEDDNLTNWNPS